MKQEQLVDTQEVARLIGYSTGAVEIWRSRGESPIPYYKVGRLVKYRLSDVETFIQKCRRES